MKKQIILLKSGFYIVVTEESKYDINIQMHDSDLISSMIGDLYSANGICIMADATVEFSDADVIAVAIGDAGNYKEKLAELADMTR